MANTACTCTPSHQVLAAKDAKPKKVLQDVVNKECSIFTEVAGLDLTKELEKLQKKGMSFGGGNDMDIEQLRNMEKMMDGKWRSDK